MKYIAEVTVFIPDNNYDITGKGHDEKQVVVIEDDLYEECEKGYCDTWDFQNYYDGNIDGSPILEVLYDIWNFKNEADVLYEMGYAAWWRNYDRHENEYRSKYGCNKHINFNDFKKLYDKFVIKKYSGQMFFADEWEMEHIICENEEFFYCCA